MLTETTKKGPSPDSEVHLGQKRALRHASRRLNNKGLGLLHLLFSANLLDSRGSLQTNTLEFKKAVTASLARQQWLKDAAFKEYT